MLLLGHRATSVEKLEPRYSMGFVGKQTVWPIEICGQGAITRKKKINLPARCRHAPDAKEAGTSRNRPLAFTALGLIFQGRVG